MSRTDGSATLWNMDDADPALDPLRDPDPPWPPDPIETADVREAIRTAQEDHLARFEQTIVREATEREEANLAAAQHAARIHALQQHLSVFLRLVREQGNPGLVMFPGGTKQGVGLTFLERLQNPPIKVRDVQAWPVAFWRQSMGFKADIWSDPRSIIGLMPSGDFWRGGHMVSHEPESVSFYSIESISLKDMTGDFYSPIRGLTPTGLEDRGSKFDTTIDRAIVGSIAAFTVRHDLLWP